MAKPSRIKNLSVAGILALTGCLTLVIALGALFLGLWLDKQLGFERGIMTIILVTCSAPLSLFLMIRLALGLLDYLRRSATSTNKEE